MPEAVPAVLAPSGNWGRPAATPVRSTASFFPCFPLRTLQKIPSNLSPRPVAGSINSVTVQGYPRSRPWARDTRPRKAARDSGRDSGSSAGALPHRPWASAACRNRTPGGFAPCGRAGKATWRQTSGRDRSAAGHVTKSICLTFAIPYRTNSFRTSHACLSRQGRLGIGRRRHRRQCH